LGVQPPSSVIASPFQTVVLPDGKTIQGEVNLQVVFIVVLVSCILVRGIKESAIVNSIVMGLKLAVILIFIVVGWFFIDLIDHPLCERDNR